MQTQQIIDMAIQAGIRFRKDVFYSGYCDGVHGDELEHFANLVAKAKAEEIATELLKGPVNDTAASIAIWIRDQA
jgi:hypothetical protein